MNKYFFILLCLGMIACNPGPRPTDAVKFNDLVVYKQDTFYMHLDAFVSLIRSDAQIQLVEEKYHETLSFAKHAYDFIETQEPFDEIDDLRLAALQYFQQQIEMMEIDFAHIIKIYSLSHSQITVEHETQWDSLMDRVVYIDSLAIEKFLVRQHQFAERYGISLRDID